MLCAQLAVLKASRERDRDLLNRQSTETRDTTDELMSLRAKLRDAEILAEDRLSDLDDTRRRCACAASCTDICARMFFMSNHAIVGSLSFKINLRRSASGFRFVLLSWKHNCRARRPTSRHCKQRWRLRMQPHRGLLPHLLLSHLRLRCIQSRVPKGSRQVAQYRMPARQLLQALLWSAPPAALVSVCACSCVHGATFASFLVTHV